jgi:hypothetical protein
MTVRSRNDERTGSFDANGCSAETIRALSGARRRRIVVTLLERNDPLPVDDLASAVVDDESGSASTDREAVVTLYHVDLPVLRAADLVTVDEDEGLVELGPNPGLRRGPLSALLLRKTGSELWSALDTLQDPVRSSVVEAVDAHESTVAVDDLVQELASESVSADGTTPSTPEELGLTLRHVHLPKLDAAGLIRYDDAADTVSCEPRRWV